MKSFNLQEAINGKPVVTRDGDPATFIIHKPEMEAECLVFGVKGRMEMYYENGKYYKHSAHSSIDLFMKESFIDINGHKYPEPERKPLQYGQNYWIPHITSGDGTNITSWSDAYLDHQYLKRGLVHLSKENALEHYKAMILSGKGTP